MLTTKVPDLRCQSLWQPYRSPCSVQVEYQAEGFLEKNKDSLPDSIVSAVKYSSISLIRTLFLRRSEHSTGNNLRKSILIKRQEDLDKALASVCLAVFICHHLYC